MNANLYPPPKQPRFIDVTTELRDFALVTYAVAPAALANHLPPGFEPEVFALADGTKTAFISAALFHDFGFRPAIASWPKFSFAQTNYRAYIRRGEERCVWFFGTALHTPLVVIPRYAWKLPWHYADIRINSSWQENTCLQYNYTASGKWGNAQVQMLSTDEPMGRLDGFVDEEQTRLVLTHPLTGYYKRTDGRLGTYHIWHDRLVMHRASVQSARFEVFEQLDLIAKDSIPHSALLQRSTEFIIYLPPSLVR